MGDSEAAYPIPKVDRAQPKTAEEARKQLEATRLSASNSVSFALAAEKCWDAFDASVRAKLKAAGASPGQIDSALKPKKAEWNARSNKALEEALK